MGWVIVLAVAIIVVIPVGICMTGAAVAGLLGWTLKNEGEDGASEELVNLS